jgi:hypothetical protein
MNALVTQRFHKLSDSLVELKVKVREAMATELATAVGTAVRDIVVVAMIDRLVNTTPRPVTTTAHSGGWRHDGYDRLGEPKDPWTDADYDRPIPRSRYGLDEPETEPPPTMPTTAAIAVGVHVGRWWLARNGTLPTAIGVGVLATALGFTGGPLAHAALTLLAAATDLLTADSALARPDPA